MPRILPACLALAALLAPVVARADSTLTPAPIPDRVARAACIVVGKVTGFGDRAVNANPYYAPDGPKADHQVAVVKVESMLLGDAKLKDTRIGFVPAGPRRAFYFNLTVDEEACYFLTPHPTESFFVLPMYYDRLLKKGNANFDKEMDLVKRCVKLLADPVASLKSKNAEDRSLTAAMLVIRYRTRPPGTKVKTDLVSAEESKLILQALADGDWTDSGLSSQMGPGAMFFRLGLTERDGWTTPPNLRDVTAAAKKWIKENAGKYRIQRFVVDKP
jgi:hypothetical protein